MYVPALEPTRQLEDSPMKDVALALHGEMDKLKPEYFQIDEQNQELQLAAVEAVIRVNGRVGLEWAINYKLCTHWWEPKRVFKRLRAMLIENKAPGQDDLKEATELKDLKKWYDQYGASYLELFRAEP